MGAQLSLLRWFSSHNFYHVEKSSTYVANGSTFRSSTARVQCQVLLQNTVNIGGVSITDYTSAEMPNVSELEISFSLERKNLTESAAWLDVPLPCSILWTEFILQWKVWWMLARSPSSPSTLEIKSMKS